MKRPHWLAAGALIAVATFFAGCTSSSHAGPQPTTSSAAPAASTNPPPARTSSAPASSTPVTEAASPTSAPVSTAAAHPAAIWPTYHHDAARTGNAGNVPAVTTLRVAATAHLDGAIYASPLVLHDATGNLIIAATENDTVYALRDDGSVVWHQHVGTPVDGASLPCGDVNPSGITGTPVYDPSTGLVFAVAFESGEHHVLYAFDAETGHVAWTRAVDPAGATVSVEQQRGALTLSGGRVWVAYGGLFGDCGPYHGYLVGVPTDNTAASAVYRDPGAREGGFWAPTGPAVDAAGHLYVPVGNGSAMTASAAYDLSDGVIELAGTSVQSYFAPPSWRADNASDFGTTGVVVLPGGSVFINGKSGIAYLLKQNALGGITGNVPSISGCRAFGGPAYADGTMYLPCTSGLRAVRINGNSLSAAWQAAPVGAPIVGGGVVLSLQASAGVLYALDPATGAVKATVKLGDTTTRFATPAMSDDGHAYVGTLHGDLVVLATS